MESFLRTYFRISLLILLGMILLFLDFFSKAYVYHVLSFYNPTMEMMNSFSIPIFVDVFGVSFFISLATNTGAAWGMFENFQTLLLVVRIVLVIGMFVYLFFFNRNPLYDLPLTLIISGALGNIIDFFLYGFVVDFLHFNLWGYHFPIFNFADSCITIGVTLLFLFSYFKKRALKQRASDIG